MTAGAAAGSPADHALARRLAAEAGAALLRLRAAGGADLGRAGDRAAHRLLVDALAAARPRDAVLSEEGVDDPRRLVAERVWIVDPLDGTREYAEAGRADWAVHVVLWDRGELVAGAVGLPALGEVLATDAPPVVPPRTGRLRLAVSRSRPPAVVAALAAALDADVVPLGSAGFKAAAVARGVADAYVHAGGQYEWDSAAPVAVARAAGLWTSRIDGTPLQYNQPDPWLPDLVVCRPELAQPILAALASLERGTGGP